MRLSLDTREKIFALALIVPCFLFITIFAFYPILYSFYLSFHRLILALPSLGQPFVGLENYRELLNDRVALHSLVNTLLFVFITTFFEILFGLIIALIINRGFRGRGLVMAAVLVPWAIPTVVSSQMWRFIFNDQYGLLNLFLFGSVVSAYKAWLADPFFAFSAIVVADVWKASSFAGLLILAGLWSWRMRQRSTAAVTFRHSLRSFCPLPPLVYLQQLSLYSFMHGMSSSLRS